MMHQPPQSVFFDKLAAHWKLLVLAFCAMLINAATLAVLPLLIQELLDSIFIQQDMALMQGALLAMLALFAVRAIAGYVSSHTIATASSRWGADLRMALFDKLLTLPVNCYRQLNKTNEIDALISQIHYITQCWMLNIVKKIHDGLVVIGLILCLFFLNQEFAVLLMFVAPLMMLIFQTTRDHLSKLAQRNVATENLSQYVHQSIKQYREIRLNGGQIQECQRLGKIARSLYEEEIRQASHGSIFKLIGELMAALILAAILYFITQQTFERSLNLADVGALIAAALLLINPLRRFTDFKNNWQYNTKEIKSVRLFLDRASEEDAGVRYLKHIQGKLEFRQLRVQGNIDDKPILGPINLTVKPGETIVFTRYTAEEKNILIDLLLRMQQPSSGTLLLDDHPLNDIALHCLHSNIGIVMKESLLLSDKIAGNIAYGKMRCANEFSITAAAQASHAMTFIRELPEGLQTSIGEGKSQLTPMQRHYIAIARNFLKNPPVLILDELPAVDTPDLGILLSVLDKLTYQRTTVVFSQHIPALKNIDRIVVLENGCITENLTHMNSSQHR